MLVQTVCFIFLFLCVVHHLYVCTCGVLMHACHMYHFREVLPASGYSLPPSTLLSLLPSLPQFCTPLEKLTCLSKALTVMSRTPADSAIGEDYHPPSVYMGAVLPSVCLSVCLSVCVPACLSVCLYDDLSVSVCLSVCSCSSR